MNKTLSLLFALAFLTGGLAAQPKRRAPSRPAAGVTLNIKAGVITTAGDAKPVTRREFMVFKDDIEPTLATIDDGQGDHLDVLRFHFSEQLKELGDEHYDKALAKLQPLIIAKFTTDFQGNAECSTDRWRIILALRIQPEDRSVFLSVVHENYAGQKL